MEQRITIGNKTWIVPASALSSLIAWLNHNAVDANMPRQQVKEIQEDRYSDPRQLLTENQ